MLIVIKFLLNILFPLEKTLTDIISFIFKIIKYVLLNEQIHYMIIYGIILLISLLLLVIIIYGTYLCKDYNGLGLHMPIIKKNKIWDYIRSIFETKVIFEDEETEKICKNLNSQKESYILTPNHHGFILLGVLLGIITNSNYFNMDKTYIGAHNLIFKIPILSEIIKLFGAFNISKQNLIYHIEKNNNILVIPGGAREMSKCNLETLDMNFTKRDGILKLSYEYKKKIIPIFIRGANRIFQTHKIPYITDFISNNLTRHYPIPLFVWGPMPVKLTTYVCSPVNPNDYKTYNDFKEAYYIKLLKTIKRHEYCPFGPELSEKMDYYKINDLETRFGNDECIKEDV